MKESPIFSKCYDLLRWLLPLTVKFPRQHRFVLAAALQQSAMEFQENLIEAVHGESALPALRRADVALNKLRLYMRLSHDLHLLSHGQYEHCAAMTTELGRLLGGWMRSVSRRQ